MKADKTIIQETTNWLKSVVIHFNFCPFAKRELDSNRIRFSVCHATQLETFLEVLIQECEYLDTHSDTETTLLISPYAFMEFDDYLIALELAQALLETQGYDGTYQLASFHPDYCFDNSDNNDPANYTNRSPYPMIHILREASLESALEHFEQPELIPEHNIENAREAGIIKLRAILESCYSNKKN